LTGAALVDLYDHVDGCARCQGLLDQLSDEGADSWGAERLQLASSGEVEPGLAEILQRSHTSNAPGLGHDHADADLGFLGPPRRAGDLGMLGSYDIEAELGRGGMGIVLRGWDGELQRRVAIKVLRPELAHARARARFVREAQAAARVRHDHIVGVYAVASPPDGPPYLAMEYVAGPTLADRIRTEQRLAPLEVASLCAQAADGLTAAHAAGLIHRDIKPSNILIDPATGRARIGDFGLAQITALPSDLTQEGTIPGTPAYMSPEQAQGGEHLDSRADIYSLGATLYEALTGEVPFRGTTAMVLKQVQEDEPRPPRRLNDRVPRDLETICLKALAKQPGRRYPSAESFAADLRRWQRGEPIQARPAGAAERLWRWCRRKRLVAAMAAALLTVFAFGLAGVSWEYAQARRHLHDALIASARADENFQYALDAVEQFHTRVSEDRLLNEPGMQPLRRELLETARSFYDRFVSQRRDDPTVRAELGRALFRLATLTHALGSPGKAREQLGDALGIQESLAAARPGDLSVLHDLARSYQGLGVVYAALGEDAEAESAYQKAQSLSQRLTDERPENLTYLELLYRTYSGLGVLHLNRGRLAQAEAADDKALSLGWQWAENQPTVPESRRALARSYNNLAVVYHVTGRPAQAEAALKGAVEALALLTNDHPGVAEYERDYARTSYNLASQRFRSSLGTARESADYFARVETDIQTSISLMQALARANSQVTDFQSSLAHFHGELGLLYQVTGQDKKAEEAFRAGLLNRQRLALDHPEVAAYAVESAGSILDIANVERDREQTELALAGYAQAMRTLEDLLRHAGQHAPARQQLGLVHAHRGIALLERGDLAGAKAEWDEVLRYIEGPGTHLYEFVRAMTQARISGSNAENDLREHYAQAVAEANAYMAYTPLPSGSLYLAALVFARAAATAALDERLPAPERTQRVEQYSARAVALLRRAVAAGFFRSARRVHRLETDADLVPLQARPDFKQLLRSIAS
jgi:serine/threonine-protein kinase